ncbi:MAG: multicopper oxidase domain-containing protein [Polyangiaceae bacterium]|nr:multicopper oxidase domain-containing protein [Polyangiaceae bacterium]
MKRLGPVRVLLVTTLALGCSDDAAPPPKAVDNTEIELARASDESPEPDVFELTLEARTTEVQLGDGPPTPVWSYNGTVPGPLIEAKVGDRLVVHFQNSLDEETTIHWHGVRLPATMDGTLAMQDPVLPGGSFDYEFELKDAGLFWFHPHAGSATTCSCRSTARSAKSCRSRRSRTNAATAPGTTPRSRSRPSDSTASGWRAPRCRTPGRQSSSSRRRLPRSRSCSTRGPSMGSSPSPSTARRSRTSPPSWSRSARRVCSTSATTLKWTTHSTSTASSSRSWRPTESPCRSRTASTRTRSSCPWSPASSSSPASTSPECGCTIATSSNTLSWA